MFKNRLLLVLFFFFVLLTSCAKRGSIYGGLKDTLPPVLQMSSPKNFSVNFKGKEIKLSFNEYVILKDLNKQLIVSPPMTSMPTIEPTTASKTITISLNDSLKANTTYSFNFGKSIVDNNEGNAFNQFKYVFSTGNKIDSLTLKGTIKDAFDKEIEKFVTVMLYEKDASYTDSTIYKKLPRYITNTLDSAKTFKIDNIKAGKYMLVALKDKSNNNKFDPKEDKIGFHKKAITIPNDSIFELELFKERQAFNSSQPRQASNHSFVFGYSGNLKNPKATLSAANQQYASILTQHEKKDSLQIWFKDALQDSIRIQLNNDTYTKQYQLKIRKSKADSLKINSKFGAFLPYNETFTIRSLTPLQAREASKIKIINKDSIAVPFQGNYDEFAKELKLEFTKETDQKYTIFLEEGAITDIFNQVNKKQVFRIATRKVTEYGNLKIKLKNVPQFPVLVELLSDKGDVLYKTYSKSETVLDFQNIEPNAFTFRLIYDENQNQEYDPGNFILKQSSEKVYYFPKSIDVRANWEVEQIIDLENRK